MSRSVETLKIDLSVFLAVNLVSVLTVGIFLVRSGGLEGMEEVLGIGVVAMIVPVGAAVLLNSRMGRDRWTVVLPLVLAVFLIVELFFDYILKLDFRGTPLQWPHIALFCLAVFGMMGCSFRMGTRFGSVTLGTYFLQLAAFLYASLRGVG